MPSPEQVMLSGFKSFKGAMRSTLYDLDELTEKVIGTFKKYRDQHPRGEVHLFENWMKLFIDWTRYEDGGPTSSSTENEYHPDWTPNGHSHEGEEGVLVGFIQEVQTPTGVKTTSDEPRNGISENTYIEIPPEEDNDVIHHTYRGELLDHDIGWPTD